MEQTKVQRMEEKQQVDFTRQRDFYDPSLKASRVTLIGCGGIGSPTAVSLAKFGITELMLVDDDVIEVHNLPNQFFPINSVGKKKVQVTKQICELFGFAEVKTREAKIQDCPEVLNGIVVTGLDNMEARKYVYEQSRERGVRWLVDGRISGLNYQLYTIDLLNKEICERYEFFGLFGEEEAVTAPCTARAIIHVMWKMAADIQEQVWKILTGREVDPLIAVETEEYVQWLPFRDAKEAEKESVTAETNVS